MKNIRKKKTALDVGILAVSCFWVIAAYYLNMPDYVCVISLIAGIVFAALSMIDMVRQTQYETSKQETTTASKTATTTANVRGQLAAIELILLDEQEKPVKSWKLAGKISMIIGRKNKDEEIDIDLSDCEYSALIDIQHAVLNYCLDCWYLEDLASHNGVRVKKVEDGICYCLTQNRPCKIQTGDVIYIANTRLLFT